MNFTNSNNTDKNRPAEHIKHASLHLFTPSAPLCLRLADSTHYLQLLYQSSGYNFYFYFYFSYFWWHGQIRYAYQIFWHSAVGATANPYKEGTYLLTRNPGFILDNASVLRFTRTAIRCSYFLTILQCRNDFHWNLNQENKMQI